VIDIDNILIATLVFISGIYVAYTLSSIYVKRLLWEWIIQHFGIRVYTFLSPNFGCNKCAQKPAFSRKSINNIMKQ